MGDNVSPRWPIRRSDREPPTITVREPSERKEAREFDAPSALADIDDSTLALHCSGQYELRSLAGGTRTGLGAAVVRPGRDGRVELIPYDDAW